MKNSTADNATAFLAGLALFALVFIATDANATKTEPPKVVVEQEQGQHQGQDQGQAQDQNQGQDQSQHQDASANNEGNSLTVEGDTYDIPVSTAYAPTPYSAMGCTEYFGFGNTSDDGSVSIGLPIPEFLSRKQKDCKRIDDALWLEAQGLIDEAIAHRCETRSMVRHYGDSDTCAEAIKGATNYNDRVQLLQQQLEAANARADLAKRHEGVCKESKERCEDKLYGGK